MGSMLYFPRKVSLSPVVQRYVASCDCPPSYPNYSDAKEWKSKLLDSAKSGENLEIDTSQILTAFPTLAYLVGSAEIEGDGIQSYFEGRGKGGHNLLLYSFARKVVDNPRSPRELRESILKHADSCSVKLADWERNKVWSIYGERDATFSDPFGVRPERYALVHGLEKGSHIVVRPADEKEAEVFQALPEMWRKCLEQVTD